MTILGLESWLSCYLSLLLQPLPTDLSWSCFTNEKAYTQHLITSCLAASSDFLTGTVSIPFFIAFSFGIIPYNSLPAHLMYVIQTLLVISGSYHILVITGDMHFAIAKPLRHQSLAKSTVWKLSFGVWIISAAFSAVSFAWWKDTSPIYNIAYSSSLLFIVFLVRYIFMIYAYVKMFIAISKRNIPGQENN